VHEAGHAIATVLGFRAIGEKFFPIKFIEISAGETPEHQWGGSCFGPDVYSVEWGEAAIIPRHFTNMEWQIIIDIAGPVAETIYKGERRKAEVMSFAIFNCGSKEDFRHAGEVLKDLRALTKRQYGLARFAERARSVALRIGRRSKRWPPSSSKQVAWSAPKLRKLCCH
jgi:hypothetical protein